MNNWFAIGLTFVLLGLNALFVASEFALISARRTQLEPLAQSGRRSARLALKAMENVTLAMAAAQLGITMCSLGLGAISEPAIAHLLEPAFELLDVPPSLVHPISFAIALTLVVFLHVVYGEMVPKNLALAAPDRASLVLGPFMLGVIAVLKPLVIALNAIANSAVRIVGIEPKDEVASTFTHDEVAGLVEESRREGLLDEDEYDLVTGALDFHDATVARVLMPRDTLVTIGREATPADVEIACARTGFSRFPVVDDDGELVGYLHIKDVLETDDAIRTAPIADKWVRPLATVGSTVGLLDALRTMQARGSHMARVADQGSGTVLGVVMLEDVLEELVGEIRDAGRQGSRP
ncbi:HlyC/CorC family transporter [Aeromicrobium sp. YIM 150415]|uniref:HlyC/CorC family transporter n=1 Tax=Aeromicrobium piscarium TaxID=2590901 RepID=A0A554SPV4_9ACTN|nr:MULTISPECIES: hemolysin family protein [Aeromicrobium]MBM9462153.1 HlyC/CorC family transporter [Aeromicrobium sp. YIM 150415]TSD68383.1 HlyC/CorC family transporter [Aeromicrobium piscarium]